MASNWMIANLRLSLFSKPELPDESSLVSMWEKLSLPLDRKNTENGGLKISLSGKIDDISIRVFRDTVKTDWIYEVSELNNLDFPLMELEDSLNKFKSLVKKIIENYDLNVVRIAFGIVLLEKVESHIEGYEKVFQFLPFNFDAKHHKDFIFQINKLDTSDVLTDLEINKISKWGVLRISPQIRKIDTDQTLNLDPKLSASLELDVNTDQKNTTVFNKNKLGKLFEELVSKAKEIYENGLNE